MAIDWYEESSTYRAIFDKGYELAPREARARAYQQGRLEEARRLIVQLGRRQFGKPAREIKAILDGITGINSLEHLYLLIARADQWPEWLRDQVRQMWLGAAL